MGTERGDGAKSRMSNIPPKRPKIISFSIFTSTEFLKAGELESRKISPDGLIALGDNGRLYKIDDGASDWISLPELPLEDERPRGMHPALGEGFDPRNNR